jgi:hypothetical protein
VKAIALLGVLLTACAAQATSKPLEIWMIGSDIGAPEVILTHELRDALEVSVATRRLKAPPGGGHIYLPEFVELQGDEFRYRAMFTRDNQAAIRETQGTCARTALDSCASRILGELKL